jgi:hypothetical protein
MKTKSLFFLLSLVILVLCAPAQTVEWSKVIGDDGNYIARYVEQTSDGGFILTGSITALGSESGDIYVVKTDSQGNVQWTKTFGGTDWDMGFAGRQTSGGGYIICGLATTPEVLGNPIYLIKTDATGTEEWSNFLGEFAVDYGCPVQQTSDGGFILIGTADSQGMGGGDIHLIKTDTSGNETWSKTFGGELSDTPTGVEQTTDGGYIISGVTESYGAGDYDVYLIKADAAGNEMWSKTFGGENSDFGYAVAQTSDGGCIVVGETDTMGGVQNTAVYLIRTDASGNELWFKTFGIDAWGYSVRQTTDGGFVVAGTATDLDTWNNDVYVIKTDSEGNETWSAVYGGDGNSEAFCIQQTSDGGYIVAGYTDAFSFDNKIYLIKIAPEDPGFTPAGSNIEVTPAAPGGENPVTLLFSNVTQSGITSLTIENTGPVPPEGFSLGDPPTYYHLTTTAQFSGNITVCIDYSDVTYTDVTQLQLFHYENDTWTPITTFNDIIGKKICGAVTSFSFFAVFEETQSPLPPVLNPVADHTVLWPPNHKMVDIVIETNVSSPDGSPVTLSAVVSSNEPVNGAGDGDRAPDWTEPAISQDNEEIRLQLRAERAGTGTGRVYTVSVTAAGQSGPSTTVDIQIVVPKNNKGG